VSRHASVEETVFGLPVAPLLGALGDLGFDGRGFLRRTVRVDVLADADRRISLSSMAAVWRAAGEESGDPLIAQTRSTGRMP
jgi:hypothetical protein